MNRRPSILSVRQLILLAGSMLFLLLVLAGGTHFAARGDWQQYQRAYAETTGEHVKPVVRSITPTLTGEPELCPTCHIGLAEISPSHPVDDFGCVICHGGDRLALDEERAHDSLRGRRNPSDFSVVRESCGQSNCHDNYADRDRNHIERVANSMQATYAGGIALVRYSLGAQPDQTGRYGAIAARDADASAESVEVLAPMPVSTEADLTPALVASGVTVSDHPVDTQFRQSCLDSGCHLSEPAIREPYRFRSTSCAACHYLYDDDGLYKGNDPTIARDEPGHGRVHQLTTVIPFSQCNHCHNRGNYSLREMSFTSRPDLPPAGEPLSEFMPPRVRRLAEYYQPIGQFTLCEWELDCIDCHTSEAAMGSGHIADTISEAQATECRTCHGTVDELPELVQVTEADDSAMRQARLNPSGDLRVGDRVVVNRFGEKLWSVKEVAPGQLVQTLKVSGQELPVPLVMGSDCQQRSDQQESRFCHACHAYDRDRILQDSATP